MSVVIWGFLGGLVVGFVAEEIRARWLWREFLRLTAAAPMSTTPPTLTELRHPDWLEDA